MLVLLQPTPYILSDHLSISEADVRFGDIPVVIAEDGKVIFTVKDGRGWLQSFANGKRPREEAQSHQVTAVTPVQPQVSREFRNLPSRAHDVDVNHQRRSSAPAPSANATNSDSGVANHRVASLPTGLPSFFADAETRRGLSGPNTKFSFYVPAERQSLSSNNSQLPPSSHGSGINNTSL